MADLTPKSIFEEQFAKKLQQDPQIAKDINAVIQFDISGPQGGSWTADLTKSEGWVSPGAHASPKMVVTVSDEDLIKIVSKQLNPNMAAMSGKLRFKPMDMGLALKLGKLF
jgi:putative sterol carrier protein